MGKYLLKFWGWMAGYKRSVLSLAYVIACMIQYSFYAFSIIWNFPWLTTIRWRTIGQEQEMWKGTYFKWYGKMDIEIIVWEIFSTFLLILSPHWISRKFQQSERQGKLDLLALRSYGRRGTAWSSEQSGCWNNYMCHHAQSWQLGHGIRKLVMVNTFC